MDLEVQSIQDLIADILVSIGAGMQRMGAGVVQTVKILGDGESNLIATDGDGSLTLHICQVAADLVMDDQRRIVDLDADQSAAFVSGSLFASHIANIVGQMAVSDLQHELADVLDLDLVLGKIHSMTGNGHGLVDLEGHILQGIVEAQQDDGAVFIQVANGLNNGIQVEHVAHQTVSHGLEQGRNGVQSDTALVVCGATGSRLDHTIVNGIHDVQQQIDHDFLAASELVGDIVAEVVVPCHLMNGLIVVGQHSLGQGISNQVVDTDLHGDQICTSNVGHIIVALSLQIIQAKAAFRILVALIGLAEQDVQILGTQAVDCQIGNHVLIDFCSILIFHRQGIRQQVDKGILAFQSSAVGDVVAQGNIAVGVDDGIDLTGSMVGAIDKLLGELVQINDAVNHIVSHATDGGVYVLTGLNGLDDVVCDGLVTISAGHDHHCVCQIVTQRNISNSLIVLSQGIALHQIINHICNIVRIGCNLIGDRE